MGEWSAWRTSNPIQCLCSRVAWDGVAPTVDNFLRRSHGEQEELRGKHERDLYKGRCEARSLEEKQDL